MYAEVEVEERPWGTWKVVHEEAPNSSEEFNKTVKVLTVNAGGMLSLQSHALRDEFWVPLADGLVAYEDRRSAYSSEPGLATYLTRGRAHRVTRGTKHRLINPSDRAVSLVEIIFGTYDEDDIERYHDAYGR